ncbi:MAG: transposase [Nostoc sp.]
MTPNKNDCIPEQFIFGLLKSCPVVVNFKGEPVTSDAGLTLIAELDRKREITSRLAKCFKDYREPNKIRHPVTAIIAQRIYGLIMGYEDINDHETLRHDPIFALAVGKVINSEQESITLAGKSTLNRLEHCPDNVSLRADSRYHRIEHDASAIETLLVELFLESYRKPPRQITLDLDVTDDLVHGSQEEAFFNPYYKGYCYAPLYIFVVNIY